MLKGLVAFCFVPVLASTAVLVNRTIDDHYGDSATGKLPKYAPKLAWAVGNICAGCNIYPQGSQHPGPGAAVDATQTYNQTWHDSTFYPGNASSTISVDFVGQAVYVFNIIVNHVPYTTTRTNLVFTLDNATVGHYVHEPDAAAPQILYQVPVYSNSSLPHGQHTLVISAGGAETSLILFDYITYTTEASPVESPTQSPAQPAKPTTMSNTKSSASAPDSEPSSTTLCTTSSRSPVQLAHIDAASAPTSQTCVSAASTSNTSPATPSRSPTFVGGLIGGIIGGVIAVLLILLAVFSFRRYRHCRARKSSKPNETSGGEAGAHRGTPPMAHVSVAETSSTSSLLAPSPSPAARSSFLSEDFTAIAPYSDPKFAHNYAHKSSSPSSSPHPPSPSTHAPSVPSRSPQERARSSTVRAWSASIPILPPSSSPEPASPAIDIAMEFPLARSPGGPPAHAVDVPDPALSVTGTERSVRQAELAREIQGLETMMRDLHYPAPGPSPVRGKRSAKEREARGVRRAEAEPSLVPEQEWEGMSHRDRLRALKGEIARLRVQLSREQRLMMEAAPRNQRPGKRVLTVME